MHEYSRIGYFCIPLFFYFFEKESQKLTIEEYAKSNFKFLNMYQTMLFISNGAELMGTYVSYDRVKDSHSLVYVFEKNKANEELLNKFRNHELDWGDNVIEFNLSPTLIAK